MISRVIAETTCIRVTQISVETKWIGNVMEQDIIYVFKKKFLGIGNCEEGRWISNDKELLTWR